MTYEQAVYDMWRRILSGGRGSVWVWSQGVPRPVKFEGVVALRYMDRIDQRCPEQYN